MVLQRLARWQKWSATAGAALLVLLVGVAYWSGLVPAESATKFAIKAVIGLELIMVVGVWLDHPWAIAWFRLWGVQGQRETTHE